jgi:hypothetical protein
MSIPLQRASDQLKRYFTTDTVAARPTVWEVSLHTGNPVLGNEVTVGMDANYVRQTVTFEVNNVDLGGPELVAQATNDILVEFDPAAVGANYLVTHVAVRDATTGDLLAYGRPTPNIPVVESTIVSFAIGEILIQD